MRNRIVLFAVVAAAAGCQTLPHWAGGTTEHNIRVVDHETGDPVSGATVKLTNSAMIPVSMVTNADGDARFEHPPADDGNLVAEVSAPGFLTEWHDIHSDGSHSSSKIGIYSDPQPKVDLTLPVGFKGRIELELLRWSGSLDIEPVIAEVPRQFKVTCSAEGTASVIAMSDLIYHIGPTDVTAKYADGLAPLVATAVSDGDVAFRWVRSTDKTLYFIVGTVQDAKEYRRALDGIPERLGGGGGGDNPKKGGGGRRGGGGGGRGGR